MKLRVYVCLSLCLLLAGALLIGSAHPSTKRLLAGKRIFGSMLGHALKVPAQASPDDSRARLVNSYGRMPLDFEAGAPEGGTLRGGDIEIHNQ